MKDNKIYSSIHIVYTRKTKLYKQAFALKSTALGWKILIPGSKKLIAITSIIAIIVSFVLFASGVMNQLLFWIIAIIIAFVAYKVMPRLK